MNMISGKKQHVLKFIVDATQWQTNLWRKLINVTASSVSGSGMYGRVITFRKFTFIEVSFHPGPGIISIVPMQL